MARVPPNSAGACWNGSPAARRAAAQLVTLTAATIRGVALGVVGVALIQSLLLGIGFFAIGLQAAGLLTLVALVLGIVQVPLDPADAARRRLCLRDRINAGGGHLSGLERRRRAQRQCPQAVDAGQGAGSADAGHPDRRHRRHACRWSSRPVRRTCAAGRRAMSCCSNGCGRTRSMAGRRSTVRRNGKPRRPSRWSELVDTPSAVWHDTLMNST